MPQPQQAVQIPAEANIQSWAGETMQQPRPVQPQQNPVGGMWNPDIGIKFGGPPGPSSGGQGRTPGTWNPNSGIKFG